MQRHREARAVAFADDGYIDGELRECLLILAELKQAFKDDSADPFNYVIFNILQVGKSGVACRKRTPSQAVRALSSKRHKG